MTDSEPSDRALHIATCPVNWNNNDLVNWRPVTPFPAILDHMLAAGYTATEYDSSFGSDAAVVLQALRPRNMELTGSYQWVDFLARGGQPSAYEDLKPALQFLADINCCNLIVSDPLRPRRVALAGRVPSDGSESLDDASYGRIADGIHTIASIARAYGVEVRYHNHVGSWIEAPHEVAALLRHLDPAHASLCFDTGHYAYGGGDPCEFIRENIRRIGYLHLKDVDAQAVASARERRLTFLEALQEIVFAPVGTGTANVAEIIAILPAHRFDGWVVVEQDTCAGDPTEAARRNLAFIHRSLEAHHGIGR